MRKIKSMADIEKARRRNNIILGIIMIFLLTASSLGYSLMSADNNEKNIVSENGFDFVRDGGMWKLAIDDARAGVPSEEGKIFVFQNLPSEVDDINVNVTAQLGMYSGQPVYFVNPGEGVNEILSNIGGYVFSYQEDYHVSLRSFHRLRPCASALHPQGVYREGTLVGRLARRTFPMLNLPVSGSRCPASCCSPV